MAAFFGGVAFFVVAFFVVAFLAGFGAATSPPDHRVTHSSIARQVVPRAARPVSMPRCPPGTISKPTSCEPVSRSTSGRTEGIGAMPSLAPAKTSTGTVIAARSTVRSPIRIDPPARALPLTKRW